MGAASPATRAACACTSQAGVSAALVVRAAVADLEAGEVTAVMGEALALQYYAHTLPCTTEVSGVGGSSALCPALAMPALCCAQAAAHAAQVVGSGLVWARQNLCAGAQVIQTVVGPANLGMALPKGSPLTAPLNTAVRLVRLACRLVPPPGCAEC